MPVTKKIRFEVFKRDGFQCGYCGKAPPSVVLECDHVQPKSQGGLDDINNLITACFECNRGKKNVPLAQIPPKLKDNLEVLHEKEAQVAEYNRYLKKIYARERRQIAKISAMFEKYYPEKTFSERFIKNSLKKFIRHLPKAKIIDAAETSFGSFEDPDRAIKYFCGICWNIIKGRDKGWD